MLVIRFSRVGRKNRPQFRLVVQEHTSAPSGKHVEIVGSWDPNQKKGAFKNERIQYWLSQGAKASDSVHNLLISQEVIKGDKIKIKMSKKKNKGEESEEGKEGEAPKADEKKGEVKEETPAEEAKEEKKEETPKEESVKEEEKK